MVVEEPSPNNAEAVEKSDSSTLVPEPVKIFTVEILHMIKDAQQQHGLRHGDYQRYRGYCTRRIRRLRKALKYPQGDKRHFKRRDVTLSQLTGKKADERFIHIPLISAERAWAYAMQLKQEANTEPRKRFHLINKLRRACFYALQLQELCNTEAFDARTKLECEAYVAWMHGTLHFELQLWKSAGEHLKRAQVVYENLAKALPDDDQELYRAKVNEFTPNLRYCAYNISGGASGGKIDEILELRAQGVLENLDVLVSQTKSESSEGLQTIDWRGRKVTVRPEKVRLFLLSAQELDKALAKTTKQDAKIELIERILMDCKDAIQAVRDEIKQDPKLRSLTTGQTVSGVQYLLAYLSYIRHSRTLQRNLCLVDQAKLNFDDPNQQQGQAQTEGKRVRPQDLARLYEIILQNVTEMQQISGMEEDTQYQSEVANLALTFKAFRCYYIALTLIDMKKWKEAVALYERASNYANDALKGKSCSEFDLQSELKKIVASIDGSKFSALAYSVLEDDNSEDASGVSTKSQKTTKPLYERLSQYKEDQSLHTRSPNVFKLTPDMEPIPCKPLFFDLAMNYLELPSLEDKLESPGKKGASITGFVKGFLGWGGSGNK
ncbi:PREDICTED: signal recognition particle subunit SRP68 [Drosophila arizonae]|uniref:Signal recognition particle subunit SRP68 n=1 Tax=Drosophila arizonae TaxID=7263 RepID=A0ABM1PAE5_DROAR|nr:PREDICTED: signal recognition particle subunit SRP68 [Drosophila arizonae]